MTPTILLPEGQRKLGSLLTREEQQYCLRACVHRFTGQHKPVWVHEARPAGGAYPVQFKDDADWLANTEFAVTKTGKLRRAKGVDCYSRPTWPNNPELRKKTP